jgi:hypothetical protein
METAFAMAALREKMRHFLDHSVNIIDDLGKVARYSVNGGYFSVIDEN